MAERSGPILLAFAAGVAASLAFHMLVRLVRNRRRRALEVDAPRTPLIALRHGHNPQRGSIEESTPGIPILVMCALLVMRPGIETWEYYLWGGFALVLGLPGAWLELSEYRRQLTVGPAVAVHEEGLYLTGWRRTTFLPWPEVALVYTDPPDTGGYVADEMKAMLHVESRDGRSWRFSSRDFPPGTPAEFARLESLAALRTAAPGSMLTHGRL
ncbi:MAG TPA: hypothetical protein VF548_08685 [Allosphingosinicella sp.]|jgi:hypothetical protein